MTFHLRQKKIYFLSSLSNIQLVTYLNNAEILVYSIVTTSIKYLKMTIKLLFQKFLYLFFFHLYIDMKFLSMTNSSITMYGVESVLRRPGAKWCKQKYKHLFTWTTTVVALVWTPDHVVSNPNQFMSQTLWLHGNLVTEVKVFEKSPLQTPCFMLYTWARNTIAQWGSWRTKKWHSVIKTVCSTEN